jgi:molecular chaperone GrpE
MPKKDKNITNEEDSLKEPAEDFKKIISQIEKEKQEYFSGWQREKADFINYKNKEGERLNDLLIFQKIDFFKKILPIIDNLNRAEKAIDSEKKQDQNIKGLLMIKIQLEQFLKDQGLEALERLNKKFDPAFDEVIEAVEIEDNLPGTIIEEFEKGYCFNNQLIRPAKVKIIKENNISSLDS